MDNWGVKELNIVAGILKNFVYFLETSYSWGRSKTTLKSMESFSQNGLRNLLTHQRYGIHILIESAFYKIFFLSFCLPLGIRVPNAIGVRISKCFKEPTSLDRSDLRNQTIWTKSYRSWSTQLFIHLNTHIYINPNPYLFVSFSPFYPLEPLPSFIILRELQHPWDDWEWAHSWKS